MISTVLTPARLRQSKALVQHGWSAILDQTRRPPPRPKR
jgi:hypothetical protein